MDNALLAMGLKHKDERIAELEKKVSNLKGQVRFLSVEPTQVQVMEALISKKYDLKYRQRIAELEGAIREVLYFIDQEMPHVVLLNELLPPDAWERATDKLRKVVNHGRY